MNAGERHSNGFDVSLGRIHLELLENHLQVFFVLLLSILYLARDLGRVNFPDIVFSGICGLAFVLLDYGSALGVFVFTTAITVPHNEIMLLYIAVFLIKKLSMGGIRFHSGLFLIIVVILVIQMTDMVLFSRASYASVIYDYITKMLYVVIPLLWYMTDISPKDCRSVMLCYIWSCLLGAFVVVVLTANQVGWAELLTGNRFQRLGVTVDMSDGGMQSTYNANQLSGMMAITVTSALVLWEKKKINLLSTFLICGFAIIVVALTKSRTGLLCTAGAIILYTLYMACYAKKRVKGILFLAFFTVCVLLLLYFEPELFSGSLSRFEDQDISNGRSDLLAVYLQAWISNPWSFLFGYGIGSYQHVVHAENVSHNAITDILISWGIIGFVLVIAVLVLFYRLSVRSMTKTERALGIMPATVAVVFSMASQYLTTGYPHLRLCLLLLTMKAASGSNES